VLKTQAFYQATCFGKMFSKQSCRSLNIHRNFRTYFKWREGMLQSFRNFN